MCCTYVVVVVVGDRVGVRRPADMSLASAFLLLAALPPSSAMRLVLQRVKSASVTVDGSVVSSIGKGVLALVGLHSKDTAEDLVYCARKLCGAKLWDNENGKTWRKSVKQQDFEVLLVSQFTLYGDVSNKKHCPDFKDSMKSADGAEETYDQFRSLVEGEMGAGRVSDGVFGAMMDVSLVNDGPTTIVVESQRAATAEDERGKAPPGFVSFQPAGAWSTP